MMTRAYVRMYNNGHCLVVLSVKFLVSDILWKFHAFKERFISIQRTKAIFHTGKRTKTFSFSISVLFHAMHLSLKTSAAENSHYFCITLLFHNIKNSISFSIFIGLLK